MAIAREEVEEGGYVLLRVRGHVAPGGVATAERHERVKVLEVMRGALRVRNEKNGREFTEKFSEFTADEEWLSESERREAEKLARIAREKLQLVDTPPKSEPLKVSLGDAIRANEEKIRQMKAAEPQSLPAPKSDAKEPKAALPHKEFGARLALIMEMRGILGVVLCRHLGLSDSAVVNWTSGKSLPSNHIRPALAAALKVSEEMLFDTTQDLPMLESFQGPEAQLARIDELRRRKGWNWRELSEAAGQTTMVSAARLRENQLGERTLAPVATALGVTPNVIRGWEPMPAEAAPPPPPEEEEPQETVKQRREREEREAAIAKKLAPPEPVAPSPPVVAPMIPAPKPKQTDLSFEEFDFSAPTAITLNKAPANPMLAAWIEMGRKLREPIVKEMAQINARLREIAPEVRQLRGRYEELKHSLQQMDEMLKGGHA